MARAAECRLHEQRRGSLVDPEAEATQLRRIWGVAEQIAKVRMWMLYTLCDWIDMGVPEIQIS